MYPNIKKSCTQHYTYVRPHNVIECRPLLKYLSHCFLEFPQGFFHAAITVLAWFTMNEKRPVLGPIPRQIDPYYV